MTATTRTPSRIGRKPGSIARSMRLPRRKATDLDLRRTPLQSRGQATFERILDATARLLDEVPTEAITTNLMAKAAGINVATLYQYFPNKQAVMLALFLRESVERRRHRIVRAALDGGDQVHVGLAAPAALAPGDRP